MNRIDQKIYRCLKESYPNDNVKNAAIIQPYAFPYIGYFQLLLSADSVVFYDDVNFIKKGWINRNRILLNKTAYTFTIPLKSASQNKKMNEIVPLCENFTNKFYRQLESAYRKAPYYPEIMNMIETTFSKNYGNIGDLAIQSIIEVSKYLELNLDSVKSSEKFADSQGMDKADRLIQITKRLGADSYLNPIGGKTLYQKEYFKKHGVKLGFIQTEKIAYPQFEDKFIFNPSIIPSSLKPTSYSDKNSCLLLVNIMSSSLSNLNLTG